MGPIGMQEMIVIFVVALLLFGPKKLPELGRMLGKGLSEFRRAKSELKATFESHLQELERETREINAAAQTPSLPAPDYSSPRYSYPYEDPGTWETGNSQETVPSLPVPIEPSANGSEVYPNGTVPQGAPVPGTVARSTVAHPEEYPA